MKRASVVCLLCSIASSKFWADFSPIRSSWASARKFSLYKSAGVCTSCCSTSWSTSLSPSPSISRARRLAKCNNACLRCAGQNSPPLQRHIASSGCLETCAPHTGQVRGILNSRTSTGRRSSRTRATSGMTSPARRTLTVSPMRISLRRNSSSLCSVALVTVTPPTNTGARRATGVNAPVRPTCTSMSRTVVNASSAGNLCARAKRGARDT